MRHVSDKRRRAGTERRAYISQWHRARRMNGYSEAALCQKLSQLRAYSAFSEQTVEEQLSLLETNPFFQELRSRQRRRKQQLRESRRPKPPTQQISESDTYIKFVGFE